MVEVNVISQGSADTVHAMQTLLMQVKAWPKKMTKAGKNHKLSKLKRFNKNTFAVCTYKIYWKLQHTSKIAIVNVLLKFEILSLDMLLLLT